jgi:hypothetical protein
MSIQVLLTYLKLLVKENNFPPKVNETPDSICSRKPSSDELNFELWKTSNIDNNVM